MDIKVMLPPRHKGRVGKPTIGVRTTSICFNRTIMARMNIDPTNEGYVAIAVDDDGFLCFKVLRENPAKTAFRLSGLIYGDKSRLIFPGKDNMSRMTKGRYKITREEDGWFVTDCPCK